jgi:hypothetical protein
MATFKFDTQEQLSEVFDCRYALHRSCDKAECPFGVSKGACEEAWFYGMEGRPAYGTRIEIGDEYAVETCDGEDGPQVVEVKS